MDKKKLDLYDTATQGFVLEVRPSGGKTYYLRYRDAHGKQRQHRIGDATGITFEQARSAAQTVRARAILGENPADERKLMRTIPLLETFAMERYLPYAKVAKRSWITDEGFLRLHVLPKWGKRHLDEITHEEVVEFHHGLKAKGYAPATANRILILFRHMYNLAKKWKTPGAEQNPALGVDLFQENNKRERYLTAEEVQRLVGAVKDSDNTQLKYIVPLLLLLGCRKSELLDAEWSHFDLERRSWRIPRSKSGKARHVPLSADVIALLDQVPRWDDCQYVVPNPKTLLPYTSVFYSWKTARAQAGLADVRMHDLRHSAASFLVNSGRSLYEVQRILGHSKLDTTQRYAHLSQATLLDAVDGLASASGLRVDVA
jgi:integrase